MLDWKVPGVSVAIVRDQSVLYVKGFGVRDIRSSQPVTPDTIFDIGSCAKAFTTAAIGILADEGKMQWDAKVSTYVPYFHLKDLVADQYATIRDILTHRTGLPGADLMWAGSNIPTEVLIPETREFEFANLGFIPLSYYKNHDHACFFSAHSAQKPAIYDTKDATANSRVNARLPYIFLLSRIAHYLKLIQRENIGTTKDRRVLELELNTWIKTLVTEMTDPGDSLQASHPLREAKVTAQSKDPYLASSDSADSGSSPSRTH